MEAEYKVSIVLVIVALLVFGSIEFFLIPNNNYSNQQIGTFSLANYDEGVQKVGFSVNTNLISSTTKGISCDSLLSSPFYASVTGTTININGRITVDWVGPDLDTFVTHYHQVKGYRYEIYWKDASTTSWTKLTNYVNHGTALNVDTSNHQFQTLQPGGLSIPQGGTVIDVPSSLSLSWNYNFVGVGIQVKLFATLDDNHEYLVGTQEAIAYRQDMQLIVDTDPVECQVTVQTPTTPTVKGYTVGKETSYNGIASFTIKEPAGTDVFVTVAKSGYNSVTQQQVPMDDNKQIMIHLYITQPQKYNVTVKATPAFSDISLDDATKHSISSIGGGAVVFNVFPGSHTLKVENSGIWLPSTQTIDVEGDMTVNVALQEIPLPVNHKPVVNSITESTGSTIGYLHGTYDFIIDAFDQDGDTLTYQIDWGNGAMTKSTDTTNSYSWNAIGTYQIKARAYDGDQYSDWSTPFPFTVSASLSVTMFGKTSGEPGVSYEFRAYPASVSLRYDFNWGDGTSTGWTTDNIANKIYYSTGTFTVTVSATDGVSQAQNTKVFTVGIAGNKLPNPIISAGDCEVGRPSTVKIEVVTQATSDILNIFGWIKDSKGNNILPFHILDKTSTGNSYVSTMTFTCNVTGNVKILAQAVSTAKTNGINPSDLVSVTIQCVKTNESKGYNGDTWNLNKTTSSKSVGGGSNLYNPQYDTNKTPGFEIIFVFMAIALVVLVRRRCRKQS